MARRSTLILPALLLTACQPVDSLAPVTPQGRAVSDLFWLSLALSAIVFLIVLGLMTYAVIRFRARGADDPDPEQSEGNRRVELVMTAIPAVVLAVLFALTVPVLGTIDAPPPNPLRVQVIGHQWWWEYRYTDLGFATANELHVPMGESVELSIEAADVIHSFWVPAIGWKRDAIPGKVNLIRFVPSQTGRFEGTCTEFCGTQHAWMRVIAVIEPRDAFDQWAQGQRANSAEPGGDPAARGRTVLLGQTCINCHAIRGTAAQGNVGPDLTHLASRTTLGAGVIENNPENLRRWIRDVQEVKPGVLMPAYRNMPDADLDAMAAYLGSLR